jgi:hypothetical protein
MALTVTGGLLMVSAFGQMAPPSHRDAKDVVPSIGARPELLTVLDLRQASLADQILAKSLQGLYNRGEDTFVTDDKVYLILSDQDAQWAGWLAKRQYVISLGNINDMDTLLRLYPKHDVVLADEQYANVAAVVAACDNLLLVTDPNLVKKYGLFVRQDLRGKWDSDDAAHAWVLDKYRYEINKRIVGMVAPKTVALDVLDYQIANKMFTFDLTGEPTDEQTLMTVATKFDANIPCLTRQLQNPQPIVDGVSRAAKFLLPTAGLSNLSVWTLFAPYEPGMQEVNSGLSAQPRNSYQDPNGLKMGGWLGVDNRNGKEILPWLRELAPPIFDGFARARNGKLGLDRDSFRFGIVNDQVYGADFGDDRERLWTDYLHLSGSLLDLASSR